MYIYTYIYIYLVISLYDKKHLIEEIKAFIRKKWFYWEI